MANLKARMDKGITLFARQDAVKLKAQFGPGFAPETLPDDENGEQQQGEGGG